MYFGGERDVETERKSEMTVYFVMRTTGRKVLPLPEMGSQQAELVQSEIQGAQS
jgi:hypothetical protein